MSDEDRDTTLKPAATVHGPGNLPGNQMRGKAGGPVRLASPPKCPSCGTDTDVDPTDEKGIRGKLCEPCQDRADSRAPTPLWNLGKPNQPGQTGVNLGDIRD